MSVKRAGTESARKRIARLMAYARDTICCRREALLDLLDYEGEKDSPGLPCCDVCEKKAGNALREEYSLVNFFHRNRRSYTAEEAAGVLGRAGNIRWSEEEAAEAINYLIKTGKLKGLKGSVWKNKIIKK